MTDSMKTHRAARLALLAALAATPLVAGCDFDFHPTATGLPKKKNLVPNEGGEHGSGSIYDYKVNAGGPGAPGTTKTNPE